VDNRQRRDSIIGTRTVVGVWSQSLAAVILVIAAALPIAVLPLWRIPRAR
jgi:hypothetical protein